MESNIKTAIILYKEKSLWSSCAKINESLIRKYQKIYENTQVMYLGSEAFDNISLCKKIDRDTFSRFIFIDHRLNPLYILENIKLESHMQFLFHIYGNIYYYLPKWRKVSSFIKGYESTYVLCSEKFKKLTQALYPSTFQSAFSFSPIPCNEDFSYYGDNQLKNRLGISLKTKVILYCGRLSPSKNIDGIINICTTLRKKREDFVLLLIGSFDDYNHYEECASGSYQSLLTKMINERDFIKYLPFQSEIKKFYDISDAFISISTMDGDDYGMSICEAISNGLECFLTDWGGYSSFKDYEGVNLFKVSQNGNSIIIDDKKIIQALDEHLDNLPSEDQRLSRSKKNIKRLDLNSNNTQLCYLKQEPMSKKRAQLIELSFSLDSSKGRDYENGYKHLKELF